MAGEIGQFGAGIGKADGFTHEQEQVNIGFDGLIV